MKKMLSIAAVPLAAIAAPAAVQAQEIGQTTSIVIDPQLDRSDVAGTRDEPDYAAQPLHAGPFLLRPSLSLAAGYDSNVYDRNAGVADAALLLTPRLSARLDTPLHLIEFGAMGHFRRFASEKTENSEEFTLRGQTRVELPSRSAVFANASFGRQIEPRSSVGTTLAADEPVNFDLAQARVGADLALGALTVRPALSWEQTDYADVALTGGGSADMSFRDARRIGGDLALGYQLSGLVSTFTEVSYTASKSLNALAGAERDADDWSVIAGVRGEVTPLVSAEVAVGYRNRNYDLARYRDFAGFTYRADVEWYATPLVTFRLQASQSFLNSGNSQVAGILQNRIGLTGYYDPLRNLRLSATATYERNAFRDTDTRTSRPSALVQAQYRMNRHISLGLFAGIRHQSVSGTALVLPYTSFSAGFGLTLTP